MKCYEPKIRTRGEDILQKRKNLTLDKTFYNFSSQFIRLSYDKLVKYYNKKLRMVWIDLGFDVGDEDKDKL